MSVTDYEILTEEDTVERKQQKCWIIREVTKIYSFYKEWDRMYDNWFDAMIECGESID